MSPSAWTIYSRNIIQNTAKWSMAKNISPAGFGIQCFYCTTDSDSRCRDTSLFYSQTLTDQPSDCTQEAVDTTLARIRKDIPSPDGERGNYDCVKVELLSKFITTINEKSVIFVF